MSEPRGMALRRFEDGTLDDVVVKDVAMWRAEFMSAREIWTCCYFGDSDERAVFWVRADKKGRLTMEEGEMPEVWRDLDQDPNAFGQKAPK